MFGSLFFSKTRVFAAFLQLFSCVKMQGLCFLVTDSMNCTHAAWVVLSHSCAQSGRLCLCSRVVGVVWVALTQRWKNRTIAHGRGLLYAGSGNFGGQRVGGLLHLVKGEDWIRGIKNGISHF